MFRRWLKKDTISAKQYSEIRQHPPEQQLVLFCQAFALPDSIAYSKRDKVALLLLVNSHRITWRKKLLPEVELLLRPFYHDLWPTFMDFFQYTSHQKRIKFFSEPIVKELWPRFIMSQPKAIEEFLIGIQRDHQHHPKVY